MRKRRNYRYILPGERSEPFVPVQRIAVWVAAVALVLSFLIVSIRVGIPEANAQSGSGMSQSESVSLRRREVRALEDISKTLKSIKTVLSRSSR